MKAKLKEEDGSKMKKSKQKVYYDKKHDILWLYIKSGVEEEHREVTSDISLELGERGELLGIEIYNASKVLGSKLGVKRVDEPIQSVAIPHRIR